MLVRRDLKLRQPGDLFFMLMLIIMLRSEPELLICASLIVSNNEDNNLAKSCATLWQGREQILYQRLLFFRVLGRP